MYNFCKVHSLCHKIVHGQQTECEDKARILFTEFAQIVHGQRMKCEDKARILHRFYNLLGQRMKCENKARILQRIHNHFTSSVKGSIARRRMPGSGGTTFNSCLWLLFSSLMLLLFWLFFPLLIPNVLSLHHDSSNPPDGPDVQPDKVGGGECVEGRRDPHQVCLLVPDPVEQPSFLQSMKGQN